MKRKKLSEGEGEAGPADRRVQGGRVRGRGRQAQLTGRAGEGGGLLTLPAYLAHEQSPVPRGRSHGHTVGADTNGASQLGGGRKEGGGEGWGEWDTLLALTTMTQPMWEGGKEWEWREGGG